MNPGNDPLARTLALGALILAGMALFEIQDHHPEPLDVLERGITAPGESLIPDPGPYPEGRFIPEPRRATP